MQLIFHGPGYQQPVRVFCGSYREDRDSGALHLNDGRKMIRIYVHIGLTKTGSTTIQDLFLNNRPLLRSRGIVYYNDKSRNFSTNDFPAALDEKFYLERYMRLRGLYKDEILKKKHQNEVFKHIRKTIRRNKSAKIVISSEVLSAIKPQSVKKLKKFLVKCCKDEEFSIRIICYVREPVSWFTSSFQEEIKARGRTIDNPIDVKVPFRFYLRKYINAFGIENVDVREFNPNQFAEGSLIADFFEAIGESSVNIHDFDYQTQNESLSLQAARIISEFNAVHPLYVGEDLNRARALGLHKVFGAIAGDKFAIPRSMQREVAAANKHEVAWLRSVTGRSVFNKKYNSSPRKIAVEYNSQSLLALAELINNTLLEAQRLRAIVKYYRGIELDAANQREKALLSYQDAVKFDPDFAPARQRLAGSIQLKEQLASHRVQAKASLKDRDWPKAAKALEEIYAITNEQKHRLRLIQALQNAGEFAESTRLLLEALDEGGVKGRVVRRAFHAASDQGAHEAVAGLAPAFKEVLADRDESRGVSVNAKIWHGLVWLGDIDAALDYAGAPSAPSDVSPGPPRETAIVVDPAFAPETGHGHHANNNQLYLDLLSKLGAPVAFYGTHETTGTRGGTAFDFRPTLTVRMYTPRRAIEDERWLRNINEYFYTELRRQVPPNHELFICHSVRHTTILGLARWMEETQRDKPLKLIIGIIDSDLGFFPDRDEMIRSVYAEALEVLKRLPDADILMYCETQKHLEILRELGGEGFDIRILPYVASSLALNHISPGTTEPAEDSRITLGYLGGTRHERGADILPHLIRSTREVLGDAIDWSVQLDLGRLKRFAGPVVEEHLPAVESDPGVELVDGRVSGEDYFALLDRMDIVVLPYRHRYEVTGSGVFIEGLSLGKVQVLPEKGWMTEYARRLGCDPVTFPVATFENVLAAAKEAVERYPELRTKALKAAEIWNSEEGSAVQVETWLRERLPSTGFEGATPVPAAPARQL
ncbi:MAG: hypothetical protein GY798_02030 [Hyphomicrobiales bacterium]|nr:hypothetical protein [Hyphomicrobiales bacterium]